MTETKSHNTLGLLGGLIVLILGVLGYLQLDGDDSTTADPSAGTPTERSRPGDIGTGARAGAGAGAGADTNAGTGGSTDDATTARHAFVDGPDGRVDIAPTLERIERGEKHPHRNDGSVFQNRERRLPAKPRGYYHEYVHPTPGERGPGAQRVVLGDRREVWYTPDHYETFQQVEWTFRNSPR